jgi:hypothetical protein
MPTGKHTSTEMMQPSWNGSKKTSIFEEQKGARKE